MAYQRLPYGYENGKEPSSIAGVSGMAYGAPRKVKPPVDAIEGIGGVQLVLQCMWRFHMKNHYEQEFVVDALMIPQ